MQLLLITVASLVLVVFVVSIIFSCWWIKSRQEAVDTGEWFALKLIGFARTLPAFSIGPREVGVPTASPDRISTVSFVFVFF